MSRNSQQNRAARKRKRQQRESTRSYREDRNVDAEQLIYAGIEFGFGPSADARSLRRIVDQLARFDNTALSATLTGRVALLLDGVIDHAFASGWQPAELVHAVRREIGARAARLCVAAIGSHARRTSAHKIAPAAWRDQLDELRITPDGAFARGELSAWREAENTAPEETWAAILTLVGYCSYLIPMHPLLPPPARWRAETATASSAAASGQDPKMLARIRGLLTKAESSTFAAEAETLTAKAQDLMTRYAIDSAMVDAEADTSLTDQVATRRLQVDNPYPEAKVQLLHCVAESNGVRVIWHQRFGLVSMVGLPLDLDLSEMLYTSLLLQASHALAEEGGGHRTKRSPSFRRSFLLAFADRIGERLATAREQASRDASSQYGKELVPVMAARTEAVGSVFEEQFPSIVPSATSVTNPQGWQAGRVAAELADLAGGRERIAE